MARLFITRLFLSTISWSLGLAFFVQNEAFADTACNTANKPFCSSDIPLPLGWSGHIFQLSQNYPQSAPADSMPWLSYNPTTEPDKYIQSVLQYFFEGNIRAEEESSFDPILNPVRNWYNAPWQDFGVNGREPIHGLTRERTSQSFELDPHQSHQWNNYAVGFYNAAGAVTIGKVWADHTKPDATVGIMPEGTVAAKLLFTTAPVDEVPYLKGSPTWHAFVYKNPNDPAPTLQSPRAVLAVRLLQIDIAVKDSRVANTTGWVFGTFVYGGGPGGKEGAGWANVSPVGLTWGNDPKYSGTGPLSEAWINPSVHMPHLGYQGRLNGPVDNAKSACLSCHATAESAPAGVMVPEKNSDPTPWFRNIPSGTPFDTGRHSLDYSLQISVGISNFEASKSLTHAENAGLKSLIVEKFYKETFSPPRDGGPIH